MRHQLLPEADAQRGHLRLDQPRRRRDRVPAEHRVSGPVAHDHPDGVVLHDVRVGVVEGGPHHAVAPGEEVPDDAELGPAVEQDDDLVRVAVDLRPSSGRPSSRSRLSRTSWTASEASSAPSCDESSTPFARTPIITPLSLSFETSALVSTSLIPGMPSLRIHSESVLLRGPVAGPLAVLLDHDPADLDRLRLELPGQAHEVEVLHARDAVVPDERVGEAEDLSREGWVGHRLGIPDHPSGEDDLGDRSSSRRRNPSRGRANHPREQGRPDCSPQFFPLGLLKKICSGRCVFKRFDEFARLSGGARRLARFQPLPLLRYEVRQRGERLPDLLHLDHDYRVGVAAHGVLDVDVPPGYLVVEVDECIRASS